MIKPCERLDDLQLGGLKIIQNPHWFCFGVDAVLLSHFALDAIKKDAKVLDLCSGGGIIPILLSYKSRADYITGLEIMPEVAEMAERSIKLNGISDKVNMICGDLKNGVSIFGKSQFDNITCNPPYKEAFGGITNKCDIITAARHEVLCSLEDIIEVSANLLKPYGKLSMIHRPERLVDIIILMKKYKIEPKRLRFVHPSHGKTATMILIEGAKLQKPKLLLEPPLYVHNEDGSYTEEIDEIYGRDRL